jgi:hypothetical protein
MLSQGGRRRPSRKGFTANEPFVEVSAPILTLETLRVECNGKARRDNICRGEHGIPGKRLIPTVEGQIRGQDNHRTLLVSSRNDLGSFGIATVRCLTSFKRPCRCAASRAITRSTAERTVQRAARTRSPGALRHQVEVTRGTFRFCACLGYGRQRQVCQPNPLITLP